MINSAVQIEFWPWELPEQVPPRLLKRRARASALLPPCFDSRLAVAKALEEAAAVREFRSPALLARLLRSPNTTASNSPLSIPESAQSAASARSALRLPGDPSFRAKRDTSAAGASRDQASLPEFCYLSAEPARPEY